MASKQQALMTLNKFQQYFEKLRDHGSDEIKHIIK